MNKLVKKVLLRLSSQTGVILVSVIVLLTMMYLTGYREKFVYEMAGTLALIRIAYYLTRGPRPILTTYFVRKHLKKVFNEEIRVAIAFVAACFLMSWPVDQGALLAFVTANMLAQIGMLYFATFSRRILLRMAASPNNGGCEKQAIVVGTGTRGKAVADMVLRSPELDTLLVGFLDYNKTGMWRYRDIPLLGHPDLLPQIIASCQVDALLVAVEPEDLAHAQTLFEVAEKMGVTVCLLPNVYEAEIAKVRPGYINGSPMVVYRAIPEGQFAHVAKTIVDKLGALAGLALFSPIILATAIAIKLDSKGPVFFKQPRSGLNGKPFGLLKFRTMCTDAEELKKKLEGQNEMSGPVFKIKNDPRVTRVGRILRKYSIDEVPQFVNVLRGEMSLVGPRPPLPKEVEKFEPWQHRKLSVRPGVTCTWQVGGRNDIDFEEWMRLDLKYIDNWSLWEDTKIIAKTIPAVLRSRGAS